MKTADKIRNISGSVLCDEPLSRHTYYKIGGPAKIFVSPKNIEELKAVIEICVKDKVKYFILGKGSNILVSDTGYDGCIVDLSAYLNEIHTSGEIISASAGSQLSMIAKAAEINSLTGFEKLAGIPGTIGGALIMNAGCYGSEISEKIVSVNVLSDGMIQTIKKKDLSFGYRKSSLQGMIITGAEIKLTQGEKTSISKKMKEYQDKRKKSQPLQMPSCGSVFKRPSIQGFYAGKMIEDCGLKGKSSGGAMVSELHAGFIVNTGGATADDVLKLIKIIKDEVFSKFQITLEEEVIFVGFKAGELI